MEHDHALSDHCGRRHSGPGIRLRRDGVPLHEPVGQGAAGNRAIDDSGDDHDDDTNGQEGLTRTLGYGIRFARVPDFQGRRTGAPLYSAIIYTTNTAARLGQERHREPKAQDTF